MGGRRWNLDRAIMRNLSPVPLRVEHYLSIGDTEYQTPRHIVTFIKKGSLNNQIKMLANIVLLHVNTGECARDV